MLKLKLSISILILLSSVLSAALTFSQTPSIRTRSRIDSLLNQYTLTEAPGYSLAILKNGRIFFERYEGFIELESKQPATKFTNYRLASVTKQFTALAILQLEQAHLLNVEDDIQRYLPSLPNYAKSIKIKHLLNHLSGLVDYENLNGDYRDPVTDVDVLKLLSEQDTTQFIPGSRYAYSNSGYSLLASIIEKVSGQSYADYITNHIFKPLKMTNSSFNIRGRQISNRAYGYTKKAQGFEKTDQSSTSYVLGDGGIYSSISDLIKWQSSLSTSKLIKKSPLAQVKRHIFNIDANNSYACGWRIINKSGFEIFNHTGSSRGFLSYHVFLPKEKLGLIILTNRTGTGFDPGKVGDQIMELLLAER